MLTDEPKTGWVRRAATGVWVWGRRMPCLLAGVVLGAMVAGGAEAGRFVVPESRGGAGTGFAYWDLFLADEDGYNHGFANPPGLLGGEDEDGNETTLTEGVGLTQTGAPGAFVTSSGAIYSFDETTAFRVDYAAGGTEPVTSVIFQTLTGGRRFELDNIRLNYTTAGGEVVSLAPGFKALDDPQTGAFAERLVSAFQWDVSGRDVRTFRLVFGAPGSSMPLWEVQLDVGRGGAFEPELGYVLLKESWPRVRYQSAGRVVPVVAAGGETRFFRSGATVRLQGAPASGFVHAGWWHDGVVREAGSLDVTFGESDLTVAGIFAPLSYATWRTHWFDHANAVLGLPADHLNDAVSGPGADPDADGADNFTEFAFGGDPYAPDAPVREGEVGVLGGAPVLVFRRPAAEAVAVEYRLQGSVDLRGWEPVEAEVLSRELEPTGYWRVTLRQVPGENGTVLPFLRIHAAVKS